MVVEPTRKRIATPVSWMTPTFRSWNQEVSSHLDFILPSLFSQCSKPVLCDLQWT